MFFQLRLFSIQVFGRLDLLYLSNCRMPCYSEAVFLKELGMWMHINPFLSPFFLSGFKNDLKFIKHYLFDILMLF